MTHTTYWNVFVVPDNRAKVFIQNGTGEGGEFSRAAFEAAIGMSVPQLKTRATAATWVVVERFFVAHF